MKWKSVAIILSLVIIIGASVAFFSGPLFKKTIISMGESITEAKIDIDEVSLQVMPLGFHLSSVQIADKKAPMKNLLECDSVTFSLNIPPLLSGKVIIDDISVSGVEYNTPRSTSGALQTSQKNNKKTEDPELTADSSSPIQESNKSTSSEKKVSPISADDFLNTQAIKTTQEADALKEKISVTFSTQVRESEALFTTRIANINQQLNSLSDIKINSINDLKKLKDAANILSDSKKEVKLLKEDIRKQKEHIQHSISLFDQEIATLKNNGKEELEILFNTFDVSTISSGKLDNTLLTDSLQDKIKKGLSLMEYAQKLFPKEQSQKGKEIVQGQTIEFPSTKNPLPRFWVKTISISKRDTQFTSFGTISDITSNPNLINQPIRYGFNSNTTNSDLTINGIFDLRDGQRLHDVTFSNVSPVQPNALYASGTRKTEGNITLFNQSLGGEITITDHQIQFKPTHSAIVDRSLNKINSLSAMATLGGTLTAPSISIRSESDTVIKQAFSSGLSEEAERKKTDLLNKLDQQNQTAAASVSSYLDASSSSTLNKLSKQLSEVSALDNLSQTVKKKLKL